MNNLKRLELKVETEKGLEGLCKAIYTKLNDRDIDFGDNYQITISKKDVFTNIIIDYIENTNGLNEDKKVMLKELMGSASNETIDFNEVRDAYKKEL